METLTQNAIREQLRLNGFVHLKAKINPAILEGTIAKAWNTVAEFEEKLKEIEASGDLPYCLPMPVKDHHQILDHAEAMLTSIGTNDCFLTNLMLIMKLPHEGRRFWHTDDPPIFKPSSEDPPALLVIYMLQPTSIRAGNGCLLVVPGYAEGPQHSQRVTTPIEGEYAVETELGDVIIMDPRLLHGSLENTTEHHRFNVRLWIQCRWEKN